MHRIFLLVFFSGIFLLGVTGTATAKRVALVIGNSTYEHAVPLKNPKNDARSIAAILTKLGFHVLHGNDVRRSELEAIARKFAIASRGAKVALFYYAGHGLQVNGKNYLVPVDAKLADEADLDFETVPMETVLKGMERERRTNLVFLDACRDNPLARNLSRSMGTRSTALGRGLARLESGIGTLIAFATQPGNVALDGKGKNSPFTSALLKHIETPNLDVALLLRRVREDVMARTGDKQVPWSSSSLTGTFSFNERTTQPLETKQKRAPIADSRPDTKIAVGTFGKLEKENKKSGTIKWTHSFKPDRLIPAVSPPPYPVPASGILKSVKQNGRLHCGVNQDVLGWSKKEPRGIWTGLDVDFCRAISAAVFGNPDKVNYVALSSKSRFVSLQSGEIDVLVRNTSRSKTRETELGLHFVGVNFYDGQGILVKKELGVTSANQLDGVSACVEIGAKSARILATYFQANRLRYTPIWLNSWEKVVRAYESGRCDIITSYASALSLKRLGMTKPDSHILLPERLTKDSVGPWVRQHDTQWLVFVRWVLYAMIRAEELNINSQTVDDLARSSSSREVRILLGSEGNLGQRLGVSKHWARNIIAHVGNYGEVFKRNLGSLSAQNMGRSLNDLLPDGGLMSAPQIE